MATISLTPEEFAVVRAALRCALDFGDTYYTFDPASGDYNEASDGSGDRDAARAEIAENLLDKRLA